MLVLAFASDAVGTPWACRDVRQIVLGNLRRGRNSRISEPNGLLSLLLGVDANLLVDVRSDRASAIIVGTSWSVLLCMVLVVVLVYRHDW